MFIFKYLDSPDLLFDIHLYNRPRKSHRIFLSFPCHMYRCHLQCPDLAVGNFLKLYISSYRLRINLSFTIDFNQSEEHKLYKNTNYIKRKYPTAPRRARLEPTYSEWHSGKRTREISFEDLLLKWFSNFVTSTCIGENYPWNASAKQERGRFVSAKVERTILAQNNQVRTYF